MLLLATDHGELFDRCVGVLDMRITVPIAQPRPPLSGADTRPSERPKTEVSGPRAEETTTVEDRGSDAAASQRRFEVGVRATTADAFGAEIDKAVARAAAPRGQCPKIVDRGDYVGQCERWEGHGGICLVRQEIIALVAGGLTPHGMTLETLAEVMRRAPDQLPKPHPQANGGSGVAWVKLGRTTTPERHPHAPDVCPSCEWTNIGLVNYGVIDASNWLCHGCAARKIQEADHPRMPVVSDRAQGVDCPMCEVNEPHMHASTAARTDVTNPGMSDVVTFRRIPDDNEPPTERGTYRRVLEYWADYCASKGRPNTYWAEICCPGCGRGALVGSNHTVDASGMVSPSDVCPHAPCTFHEFIRLNDWARPATLRRDPREPSAT